MKLLTDIKKKCLEKFLISNQSPNTLAFSFCVGTYIAFSPFPCLHTLMVFVFTWLLGLNFSITLASSCFINNPWTLIPIYGADYVFGKWLIYSVVGLNLDHLNPSWMSYINNFFERQLGIAKPCIWSFLIGGNLLGIIVAVLIYPSVKSFFKRYQGFHNKQRQPLL